AAAAAADLEDQVVTAQFGRAHDQGEKVQVNEEALPKLVLGVDAPRVHQAAQIGQRLPRGRFVCDHVIDLTKPASCRACNVTRRRADTSKRTSPGDRSPGLRSLPVV